MNKTKFVLLSLESLPEVFEKVLTAKKLLAQGKVKSAAEAARTAGISRSAFYKYRDAVFLYEDKEQERMVNLYLKLEDEPGILSTVISALYQERVNIITVNQNIPVDGVAPVSICARLTGDGPRMSDLLEFLEKTPGVVEARKIS